MTDAETSTEARRASTLLNRRNAATIAAGVKLGIFTVCSILVTGLLAAIMGNIGFGDSFEYRAIFTSASMLEKGDDVRVAGVSVGEVTEVDHYERSHAIVSFKVQADVPMTTASRAEVRYLNLVGDRYLALEQGRGEADAGNLDEGDTIPVENTRPSLDLTVLFNGFKPLFQALSPDELNQLSYEIIQVFQGEAGTLEGLLQSTASVTQTLADRDEVISDLIDNLNRVLVQIGNRDQELTELITSFRIFVGGLKDDRRAILGSLEQISDLSVETADLVSGIRAPFVEDIKQLRRFAGNIDRNKAELDRALQVLPIKLRKVGRTAIYGSWFNFYLCEFHGKIQLPKTVVAELPADLPGLNEKTGEFTLDYPVRPTEVADRCDLG